MQRMSQWPETGERCRCCHSVLCRVDSFLFASSTGEEANSRHSGRARHAEELNHSNPQVTNVAGITKRAAYRCELKEATLEMRYSMMRQCHRFHYPVSDVFKGKLTTRVYSPTLIRILCLWHAPSWHVLNVGYSNE